MVSIGTERLVLKRRMVWHVPRLVDSYRDPRSLNDHGNCSITMAYWRLLRGCFSRRHWTVFAANTRLPIGSVGFWRWSDGRPELVYWLDPDHAAGSLATEALSGALDHRRQRPVVARSQTANLGSCLVLETLGFVAETQLREDGADQQLYVLA